MMDFTGKICPFCKTCFQEDDDIVICSKCEMPHHKNCWIENKVCTTFGCTGTIMSVDQYSDSVERNCFCSKCGKPYKEGQKFCAGCGSSIAGNEQSTASQPAGQPAYAVHAYTAQPTQGSPYEYSFQGEQQNTVEQSIPKQQPQYQPYVPPQRENTSQYSTYQNMAKSNVNPENDPYAIDLDTKSFIGSNQSYYAEKFRKLNIMRSKTSWNWAAALLNPYWFAYRKMYGWAAGYFAILLFVSFIPVINIFAYLALPVCSGLFSDYFFKKHV